jgi:hypothetical protein
LGGRDSKPSTGHGALILCRALGKPRMALFVLSLQAKPVRLAIFHRS